MKGWNKTTSLTYFADLLTLYGYNATQIYGIVPAADKGNPSNIMQMKCAYFKEVRLLVELIYSYALMQVDIISTGAGTVVARKAILGGACLDENENLGKPITNKVYTFIAVGGVCYGSEACSNENSCTGPSSLNCYSTLLVNNFATLFCSILFRSDHVVYIY
ncbi:hypothetical protein Tcan_15631 [Toxocara canis]|uniref:Uncharacterized protein n=1 Tax=Toxocara canis TaxID=6265 RepID=A0A0B2VHI3_TOXCA|nr:hypothetical protein Tcan_15631 [Toxocara canis]